MDVSIASPVPYGCITGKKRPASNTNTPKGTPAYGAVCGLPSLEIPDLTLLMPDNVPEDPSKVLTNQIVLPGLTNSGILAKPETPESKPEPHQISSGSSAGLLAKPEIHEIHEIPEHICSLVWDRYLGLETYTSNCYACRVKKINSTFYKCGQLELTNTSLDNLRPICLGCWFQARKEQVGLNKYIEQYGLHK
jgi:hypothetical protein